MTNLLRDRVLQLSASVQAEVIAIREHLHQHPELSFKEFETSKYIQSVLDNHGISYQAGIAGTGIVGVIEGDVDGPTYALRADIDALPIIEQNETNYVSKNVGVMHACGHDVHSATLLGALMILNQMRAEIKGRIKFLFQPGEELLPGGASMMINEGVLENPKVDTIFGNHVFPELEVGKVGFRAGEYMASTDEIYLTVKGKGGHGAMPHQNIDTVYVACQIIVGLQSLVSRRANPITPTVLSFGRIIGEGATNVIPAEVKIDGTFRTLNEEWRKEAHRLIKITAENIAAAYEATCEVHIAHGYPSLRNNEPLTTLAKSAAIELLGADRVVDLPIRMTAEDFSFYSQKVPACFYRVGVRNEAKGITYGVHHPKFDVDSKVFETSVPMMAYLALKGINI